MKSVFTNGKQGVEIGNNEHSSIPEPTLLLWNELAPVLALLANPYAAL
ncbi:hypothetical protein KTT_23970 [Tengunoibacter tsumagoiensis]|uniref:Uncharacterized protein n=1 Tax=Tengunoibacter tsumagoiensis TaxID=2014871 RepID=A0A402A063_9CHLR|nr:hypothetical protein KTT_23970 [Tengunoibacter tsumagoiensis]